MATWSEISSVRLCGVGEELLFVNKAVLLDKVKFSSVRKAVAQLNGDGGDTICSQNFCVVFSVSHGEYFLLYRIGKRWEAFSALGIGSCPEKCLRGCCACLSVCRSWSGGLSAVASCMCSCTFQVLGEACDILCNGPKRTPSDGRKLLRKLAGGVHTGLLTDRYDVIRQLGKGAQGAAYLVKRKGSGQWEEFLVAKGTLEDQGASFFALQELKAEFMKMQALRHPNCIKVIELVESTAPRQVFIVSEFACGGDLYKYMHDALQQGGMTEAFVANLFQQAMQGVAYFHNEGYLHNDLKPDNILLMKEFSTSSAPRVVIGDFGCATRLVGGHRVTGDPRYMPPECLRAFAAQKKSIWSTLVPETSPKSDVWSMGATLYELLSGGSIPFLYKACALPMYGDTFALLVKAVCGPEELQTEQVCPDSPEVVSLLKSMLHKDASMRPIAQEVLKYDWFHAQTCAQDKGSTSMPDTVMQHINLIASQKRLRQVLLTALAATLRYQHVEACHFIFRELDPDNSGTIPHDNFRKACERFRAQSQDIEELFQTADISDSNTLEFNEFVALTLDWQTLDESVLDTHLDELISKIGGSDNDVISIAKMEDFFEGSLDSDKLHEALAGIGSSDGRTVTKMALKRFVQRPGFYDA